MTELAKSATIDFEYGVAITCEYGDCPRDEDLHAFVVTGDYGRDGIVIYCPRHAQDHDGSDAHTHIGTVAEVKADD